MNAFRIIDKCQCIYNIICYILIVIWVLVFDGADYTRAVLVAVLPLFFSSKRCYWLKQSLFYGDKLLPSLLLSPYFVRDISGTNDTNDVLVRHCGAFPACIFSYQIDCKNINP